MIYLKIFFLFLAVLLTISNLLKAEARQEVSAGHLIVMATGITGFYYFAMVNMTITEILKQCGICKQHKSLDAHYKDKTKGENQRNKRKHAKCC